MVFLGGCLGGCIYSCLFVRPETLEQFTVRDLRESSLAGERGELVFQ